MQFCFLNGVLFSLLAAFYGCSTRHAKSFVNEDQTKKEIRVTIKKRVIPEITKDLARFLIEDIKEIDPDITPDGEDRIVTLMFIEISQTSILNSLPVMDLDRVLGIDEFSVGLHHSKDLDQKTPHKILIEKFESAEPFKITIVRETKKIDILFKFED